jgi:hypothetical protein
VNAIRGMMVGLALLPCVASATDDNTASRYEDLKRVISVIDGTGKFTDKELTDAREGMGWILGVYGVLMLEGSLDVAHRPGAAICATGRVPAVTMARLFVRYVDAHPEAYSMAPELPAILSAREAYPCK